MFFKGTHSFINLYDSHVHWLYTGQLASTWNLKAYTSPNQILKAELKSEFYRGEWLTGFGWDENNWPKAVTIYRMISKEYPLTSIGFSIPFYLGIFYHSRGLNSTAFNAFDEAAEFYRNISTNYPDSSLGLAALQMIVKCRLLLGEWTEAFYAAREAFLKYPLAASLLDTIKTIQDISIKNIHDPQLAIDVYQEFLHQT